MNNYRLQSNNSPFIKNKGKSLCNSTMVQLQNSDIIRSEGLPVGMLDNPTLNKDDKRKSTPIPKFMHMKKLQFVSE